METERDFHGTPNAPSRREIRQLFVGSSVTLGTPGALVAAARDDSTVGPGEADPV
jgi:hypothetical protein